MCSKIRRSDQQQMPGAGALDRPSFGGSRPWRGIAEHAAADIPPAPARVSEHRAPRRLQTSPPAPCSRLRASGSKAVQTSRLPLLGSQSIGLQGGCTHATCATLASQSMSLGGGCRHPTCPMLGSQSIRLRGRCRHPTCPMIGSQSIRLQGGCTHATCATLGCQSIRLQGGCRHATCAMLASQSIWLRGGWTHHTSGRDANWRVLRPFEGELFGWAGVPFGHLR